MENNNFEQQPYQAPVNENPQPQYQQPYPPQPPYPYSPQVNDKKSTVLCILSFFIPLVGLILYLTQKDQTPIKAKACGKCALISFILQIVLYVVAMVLITIAGGMIAAGGGLV